MNKPVNTSMRLVSVLMLLISLASTKNGFAEGTKEIRPLETDKGYLILDDDWSQFGFYDAPVENRLQITIADVTERIHIGFNQFDGDVHFRVKDPSGNIVFSGLAPNKPGLGFIRTHAEAIAGPQKIAGGSGYNGFEVTPTVVGDYYIEFENRNTRRDFSLFDITVGTKDKKAIKGRVWSKAWMFSTRTFNAQFEGKLYIYADDGIVTSLDFNGMQPYVFVLSANQSGTQNTGNTIEDRQSIVGNQTYPQYKIFLNDPDQVTFKTGDFGNVNGDPIIKGCGLDRCISMNVTKPGNVEILLNLNGVAGFQDGTEDRILSSNVVVGDNCIPWDSRDGLGNVVTSGTNVKMFINYFNGLTHLPLFDVESQTKGFIVELVRPLSLPDPTNPFINKPKLFWDDSKIVAPNAQKTNFAGCVTSSGCHTWTYAGNDSYATNYGNMNTINTWWYAKIIPKSAIFTLTDVMVDANTEKTPEQGNDTTFCATTKAIPLFGSVIGSPVGTWSGGKGSFAPTITTQKATYTPTDDEIKAGKVKLYLTSDKAGDCPPETDSLTIKLLPAPTITSPDTNVCENINTLTLKASLTRAAGLEWTGGAGTFVPDNKALNPVYTPTEAEKKSSVTLTITSTGNGLCASVTDQMKINFVKGPTSNAGKDTSICGVNPVIQLNGKIELAASGKWSGGNGTFTPDRNTLNAKYTPSKDEITSGSVTLLLETIGNGDCNAGTDQIIISFTPAPKVNAGSDRSICTNNSVTLAGNISGGVAAWTGGKGTFTPNEKELNATYTPSPEEVASGNVKLYLTAVLTGCISVKDSLEISFTPAPTIKASDDQIVCSNNATVSLNAVVTGATGVQWSSIGNGTFVPGPNVPNPVYVLSAEELKIPATSLTATTTGNNGCNSVKDNVLIQITPAPTAFAGEDINICRNNAVIKLNGKSTNSRQVEWSGGAGTFTNKSGDTTTYIPTEKELNAGKLILTFTAKKSSCIEVADQVQINFTQPPVAEAGPVQNICKNNAVVQLAGSLNGATSGQWTGGQGTFTPDNKSLNAQYTPSAAEIAAGNFQLFLSTNVEGNCNIVKDSVKVNITPSPELSAGDDITVCSNNADIILNGKINKIASGGTWSGGKGTFSSNNNQLNAKYVPTEEEIKTGSLNLTLTSTGNGSCNSESDVVTITFAPSPVSNPGNELTICADQPQVNLNGNVTVAKNGVWSGGNGSFTPGANVLNATYRPTQDEINAGSLSLVLTTTDNGICNAVSSSIKINIVPAPIVHAGSDQTACGNVNAIALNGSVTTATGGNWSTSGTGSFASGNESLVASYIPSAADKTAGLVILTLTSTGNGSCTAVNDEMKITFSPVPKVFAGPDKTVCTTDFPIKLNGTGSPSSWLNGTGTFTPDRNLLHAGYTPGVSEVNAGKVILVLATNGTPTCPTVSDTVQLLIKNGPVANAGMPKTICGNAETVKLDGNINSPFGAIWSTSGTGSFSPNFNALNADYKFSNADKKIGFVEFVLTSAGNDVCNADSSIVRITLTKAPLADAGPDEKICADANGIILNGQTAQAANATWTSSGSGQFSPANNVLNATYIPSSADLLAGKVNLTLTTSTDGICNSVSDIKIVTITPAPKAEAGSDITVCADTAFVQLNGSVQIANGGKWTTSGNGVFSPDAFTLNAKYYPTTEDIAKGSIVLKLTTEGNGTCNPVADSLLLKITPAPTAEAGQDQVVCADAAGITLSGSFSIASGVTWNTSGTGSFTGASNATTVYVPSVQDITNGLVTLSMKTTGNGSCKAIKDKMLVTITPAPYVNAGDDQVVCADKNGIQLTGTLRNVIKAKWSTMGSGTFSPSDSTLNAIYLPSPQDTAAHSVALTLASSAVGGCAPKSDNVTIVISPKPIAKAGIDQTVCADTSGVFLSGSVSNAKGGKWTTNGSGKFYPSNALLNPKYVPSEGDILKGSIIFTLTSTGNGTCNLTEDDLAVTITPAPTVDAGNDTITCADVMNIPLNGKITIATGGIWISSGTGKFLPDSSALNATYVPSSTDKAIGSVFLTLISKGNGACLEKSDVKKITINPLAVVKAGNDQTICADMTSVNLSGEIKVATGGLWSSTGSGTFTPSNSTLSTKYLISSEDMLKGSVKLILTSTGNGICSSVGDTVNLYITPAPAISAGTDQTICSSLKTVNINGSVTTATGGTWSTTGTGTFVSTSSSLKPTYVLSPADQLLPKVTLKVVSTGNGTCQKVEDAMDIIIVAPPTANAGNDMTICADKDFIRLEGIINNAPKASWASSGSGLFAPGKDQLNTQYFPSSTDKSKGKLTFTLTTLGNAACQGISDQMVVTILPAPTISAGPDITVCPNVSSIEIDPVITVATGAYWSTNGAGIYNPTETHLSYIPTPEDTTAGSVIFTVASIGNGVCNNVYDSLIVFFNKLPLINAGPDETICLTSFPIKLKGTGATGTWSGFTGNISPGANTLDADYTPSAAEIAANKAQLVLTSSLSGTCAPSKDTVVFTFIPGPTVDAGPDDEICKTANSLSLAGKVTLVTSGTWLSSGSGTFNNPNSLDAIYTPSNDDKISGSVTFTLTSAPYSTCKDVQDEVIIHFKDVPMVNAGPDQVVCAEATEVILEGTAENALGVEWTAIPATGSYSDDVNLNTRYQISSFDKTQGSVRLVLVGLGGTVCSDASDEMMVTILKPITVSAGDDVTACANTSGILLNATKTVAGGVEWSSSGQGIFSPSINSLQPVYIPSSSDTAAKQVTISVKTTENINCTAATDELILTLVPEPLIHAGADQEICAEVKTISLKGILKNAPASEWSTPGSGSFSNINDLNAVYTVGKQEKLRGGLILTLTSKNTGVCPQVSDYQYVRILPIPGALVNAGFDQLACINNNAIQMDGLVKGAGGGEWGTLGSGSFLPNNKALNAVYKPSSGDTASQKVKIFLVTTENGVCNAVSDTMLLSFAPTPKVLATSPKTVCADTSYLSLNGTILNTTEAIWATSGNGTFIGSSIQLDGKYFLSEEDKNKGSVGLTLTSTDNGVCEAAVSSVTVNIMKRPVIDAGIDDSMCANSGKITLKGIVSKDYGIFWRSSGTGTFLPDEQSKDAEYVPSQEDIEAGMVVIKIKSTSLVNKICKAVIDQKTISILPAPIVNAGFDQTICADAEEVNLMGKISGASGGIWTSTGSGKFVPSNTDLNAKYILSKEDVANPSLTFTLQSGASYNCDAISDDIAVTILPKPESQPREAVICDFMNGAILKGEVKNADGGIWTSSGTGTFGPSKYLDATSNTIYKPSAEDISRGKVTLSLTTIGKGTCKSVTASTDLLMIAPPDVDAGNDMIVCRGSITSLTPKINNNLIYSWRKAGENNVAVSYDTLVTVSQFSQFVLEGTDSRGCSSKDTVALNVIDPPGFNLDPHYCYMYNLLVDAKPVAVPMVNGNYQWIRNGKNIIGENKSIIVPPNSGDYVIVYSYGNCNADDSTKITDAPSVTTTDKFGCMGDSTSLQANAINGVKYQWYFKNQLLKTGNPVKTWTLADTNYYEVKATELQYNCSANDQIRIIGLPKPLIDLPGLTACSNDTIILLGRPSNISNLDSLNTTYTWTMNKQVVNTTDNFLKITESGFYGLSVTTEVCTSSDTSTIKFNPLPYSVPFHNTEFCMERDKMIILDAGPEPALKYFWEHSGKTTRNDTIQSPGIYYVTLTNEFNCKYRDSIIVLNLCPPKVYVPTAMKPGEKTEFFKVFGKDFKNFKIMVFSRWGEIIYYSEDKNESWDGTYKGQIMPIGVYPYLITYEGEAKDSKGPYKLEGTITIVR